MRCRWRSSRGDEWRSSVMRRVAMRVVLFLYGWSVVGTGRSRELWMVVVVKLLLAASHLGLWADDVLEDSWGGYKQQWWSMRTSCCTGYTHSLLDDGGGGGAASFPLKPSSFWATHPSSPSLSSTTITTSSGKSNSSPVPVLVLGVDRDCWPSTSVSKRRCTGWRETLQV